MLPVPCDNCVVCSEMLALAFPAWTEPLDPDGVGTLFFGMWRPAHPPI